MTEYFNTQVIHGGLHDIDPAYGAVMPPIYQTSTYKQTVPGDHKGFEYSRTANPTRTHLQHALAAIENGKYGLAFASGLASIDAIIKLLNPGDEVISTSDLYGGTYRLFTRVFEKYGIRFHFTDLQESASLEKLINKNTKLLWLETPTNPTLKIIDIEACAALAKKHGILTVVDNTFASPYLQRPLELGADIVMHSVTKYLGGHSDVIMGALVLNDDDLAEKLYFLQNASGAVPGPQDSFLVLRGIKTLHVRMQRHCENAREIAQFLNDHPQVKQVYWPGLVSHPNHEIARRQMKDFGGMLSFEMTGGIEKINPFLKKLRYFTLAESLGGIESLVGHPASMTHASIPAEERVKSGVTDTLIRLSVGIEDVEDLIADLQNALD
jgi:cystathionine beta-lyase/cystathionine gamma-synthase